MLTLTNSEEPDKMLHTAAFHQGLHFLIRQKTSSQRGNNHSPGSKHNVGKDHNSWCSMAVNSELEFVIRNKFKHSRYYASSGYLQVLKGIGSELKPQRKPDETIFFRCSRAANPVASDGI